MFYAYLKIILCFYCRAFVFVKTPTYKINTMHFSLAFLVFLFRSVTFGTFRSLQYEVYV